MVHTLNLIRFQNGVETWKRKVTFLSKCKKMLTSYFELIIYCLLFSKPIKNLEIQKEKYFRHMELNPISHRTTC